MLCLSSNVHHGKWGENVGTKEIGLELAHFFFHTKGVAQSKLLLSRACQQEVAF